jgi:hypothetical protein
LLSDGNRDIDLPKKAETPLWACPSLFHRPQNLLAHPLVAYCDALDFDAVSVNPGFATADAGSMDDVRHLKRLSSVKWL